jgi:hypothetical protein
MYPFVFAAGAVTAYFVVAAIRRPRPAEVLAVILWAAYAVYEYYIANGTLCDANCNIRVDLVFFWPVLALATYFAAQTESYPLGVASLYVFCFGMTAWVASINGYTAVTVLAGAIALIAAILGVKAKLRSAHAVEPPAHY